MQGDTLVQELGSPAIVFRDPARAIDWAVEHIRAWVRVGLGSELVYTLARGIIRLCQEMDKACEVRAIRDWMRANIRYVSDPRGRDVVADPEKTLAIGAGDCDDMTATFLALVGSIGVEGVLLIGTTDPTETLPTHILPGVRVKGRVLPVELSGEYRYGVLPAGFRVMRTVAV